MSVSPQPLSPQTVNGQQNNSQLATLLSSSYRESENLKLQLAATRKRAEKAERLLATFTASSSSSSSPTDSPPGKSLPDYAVRIIHECEARAERAEMARDEAEARRQILIESWSDLERYLQVVEVRAADARAGFTRILQEGGGQLVLASIPFPGQSLAHPHSSSLMPPPASSTPSRHSNHIRTNPASSHRSLNSLPLPPPPNPRIRPRAGSLDESSAPGFSGAPPPKKARGRDRARDRDERAVFPDPHTHQPPFYSRAPTTTAADIDLELREREEYLHHHPRPSHHPHTHSRPPPSSHPHPHLTHRKRRSHSHDSSHSNASSNIDDVILEAATSASSAHPSSAPTSAHPSSGSFREAGQVHTYQTHIFAPPVTGAPVKKSKFVAGAGSVTANGTASSGNINNGNGNGNGSNGSSTNGTNSTNPSLPTFAPSTTQATFPPTNDAGQRICRQCGLPGRYKEGKCVEKWGPGPAGPGTVCDRCRKKMKRVERRGTLDSQSQSQSQSQQTIPSLQQQQSAAAHSASLAPAPTHRAVHRTDTLPAHASGLISPAPSFQQPVPPSRSGVVAVKVQPSPPPAIATLDDAQDGVPAVPLRHASRSGSGSPAGPSPESRAYSHSRAHSNSNGSGSGSAGGGGKRSPLGGGAGVGVVVDEAEGEGEGEGEDVDADADADVDADAEAELLEAVDAAEANSGGAGATKEEHDA